MSSDPLPDLCDKLHSLGIFEEYADHRQNYLKWRSGGLKIGASHFDAAAAQRAAEDPYQFERWYPTPEKFQFFFTVAYWRAVTTLVGSMIFTFTSYLVLNGQKNWKPLVHWGEFVGSLVFTASAYLTYIELINLPGETTSKRSFVYLYPHWPDVVQRVKFNSLAGTLVYGGGALLFQAAVMAELALPHTSAEVLNIWCVHIPETLGGFAFFFGGLCELSHTWIHAEHVECYGAAAGAINTFAGFLFFLGAAAGLPCADGHAHFTEIAGVSYLVGSVLYTLSSVLLLKMWKCNDFGLTLLSQLNRALHAGRIVRVTPSFMRPATTSFETCRMKYTTTAPVTTLDGPGTPVFHSAAGQEEASSQDAAKEAGKRLSLRGATFITLLCWLLVAMIMNLLIGTLWPCSARDINFNGLYGMNIVGVLAVSVLLVVHSTITHVPKEQPFNFAMLAMRSIVVIATIVQTRTLMAELAGVVPLSDVSPEHGFEL